MRTNRIRLIQEHAKAAKANFETLHAAGVFPEAGDLFTAKHGLIKALNAIISITKTTKRGGVEV